MPSAVQSTLSPPLSPSPSQITKLTNCRLVRGNELVWDDIWISAATGKIIRSQAAFYDDHVLPDKTIDLGGRIVSPGLIECQLNGAFGFNFSTLFPDEEDRTHEAVYTERLQELNRRLVQTGVTAYVPTVTSQTSELYRRVLPLLAPTGWQQGGKKRQATAADGAEPLGAHVEGPFLSPTKNGVHNPAVFREAMTVADVEAMYGAENLRSDDEEGQDGQGIVACSSPAVRMITAAPELGRMADVVFPELRRRGIVCSIGHSEATYEQAANAMAHGATMITHLFNAMRPLHHRNPGIFGVLGEPASPAATSSDLPQRPFFGVISDGIHLHPTTVKIAYNAHPEGFILVTDAMHMVGCPDGPYDWTNGDRHMRLVKNGKVLLAEHSTTIAGSTITLMECVENFVHWTGSTVPEALRTVTATPAAMLGLQGRKGTLVAGADADLVVLSTAEEENVTDEASTVPTTKLRIRVDEVWKFGERVHKREY